MQIISSFFGRLFGRQVPKSLILKFYCIQESTSGQSSFFGKNALEIIKSTIKSFWAGEKQVFHRVELNYGTQVYHSVKDFFADSEFHRDIDVESIHLVSQGRGELYLSYSLIEEHPFGSRFLIELVIHSYDIVSKELDMQVSLIREFVQEGKWDYGYAYGYDPDYDIFTEEQQKRNLFSSTTMVSQNVLERRKKMEDIKGGYLPKLYLYNILNNNQKGSKLMYNTTGDWFPINDKLSFFKIKDSSI